MDEMESTGFNIDKARFYGVEPDERLTLRQDAKEFFGSEHGSPPKSVSKYVNRNSSQENLHSNIQNNKLRASLGQTGKDILRSSSVSKLPSMDHDLPERDNDSLIRAGSYHRTRLNDPPYKNK